VSLDRFKSAPNRSTPPSRRHGGGAVPVSRRGLLRWSAALAGAAALPAWAAPARADDDGAAYRAAFAAAIAEDPQISVYAEAGREFWYRPGQLLAARADVRRVALWLREAGVPFRTDKGFGSVGRFLLAAEADIPSLVAKLRDPRQWAGAEPPAVQPHHVLVGYDNIMGNPGSGPVAAAAPALPSHDGAGKGVLVGICDTGIWRDAAQFHPDRLGGAYLPEPDDEDPLYTHADLLALQAGHGTFVAGVLRQAAPDVSFDPEVALSGTGVGDEEMLVAAIDRLDRRTAVLNLSLGCRTQDDVPPLPIADRIAALGRRVVVVAAAGNARSDRPAWPAALPEVVAVAAVTGGADGTVPAPYSNFGSWVDACAEGTRTSTYVTGVLDVGPAPEKFDGFARWSGTSFAAPHVAGRIAALMTAKGVSAREAADALLDQKRWHPDYGVLIA
jgi:subtilisin family serine protease